MRGEPIILGRYDAGEHSVAHGIDVGSESVVQQHFKDEVDVNTIVRRFGISGEMPFGTPAGVFGDFTGIEDWDSALETVERAQNAFMMLPPEVREMFGNDAGELVRRAQGRSVEDFEMELGLRCEAPEEPGSSDGTEEGSAGS